MQQYYQVCSNDDSGLTLTYFTARSNFVPYAFVWEKGKTIDFSETIVVYDLKNKVNRKAQGVPQSQTAANPRHQEKETNDKN